MAGIYSTILLNDVVKRLKIADVNMLETMTRFLMHNIGNRTSPTTIANTMKSNQLKIDPKTAGRGLWRDGLRWNQKKRIKMDAAVTLLRQRDWLAICLPVR